MGRLIRGTLGNSAAVGQFPGNLKKLCGAELNGGYCLFECDFYACLARGQIKRRESGEGDLLVVDVWVSSSPIMICSDNTCCRLAMTCSIISSHHRILGGVVRFLIMLLANDGGIWS